VAFAQIPTLLRKRDFDIDQLVGELPGYQPELRALKKCGYLHEHADFPCGYGVRPKVFTIWLADELIRARRGDNELGQWLCAQEWEGLLKGGEKRQLIQATRAVGGWLKGGVDDFIKAAAEGFGKAVSGG
jgi:hypothetical protein